MYSTDTMLSNILLSFGSICIGMISGLLVVGAVFMKPTKQDMNSYTVRVLEQKVALLQRQYDETLDANNEWAVEYEKLSNEYSECKAFYEEKFSIFFLTVSVLLGIILINALSIYISILLK